MHRYKELSVWKKAMNLTSSVYEVTESFPSTEQFGLTNQIRRSSVPVASNIAEGAGTTTHSQQVKHSTESEIKNLIDSIGEIHKMLIGLKSSLN